MTHSDHLPMTARLLTIALLGAAVTVAPCPTVHAALAPADEGEPVLEITVEGSLPDADEIARNLREDGNAQLEIQRIDPTVDPADPKHIDVSISGDAYDYAVRVSATRGGQPVGQPRESHCECTKEELAKLVMQEIATSARAIEQSSSAAAGASEPADAGTATEPEPVGVEPEPTPAQPDDRSHRRLGALGYSGIAVMVVGAAGVGTGIGLFAKGTSNSTTSGNSESTRQTDLRPGGIAGMAVGGALLLAGAVMLGIDGFRRRPARRAHVFPQAGAGYAGLGVSGRF